MGFYQVVRQLFTDCPSPFIRHHPGVKTGNISAGRHNVGNSYRIPSKARRNETPFQGQQQHVHFFRSPGQVAGNFPPGRFPFCRVVIYDGVHHLLEAVSLGRSSKSMKAHGSNLVFQEVEVIVDNINQLFKGSVVGVYAYFPGYPLIIQNYHNSCFYPFQVCNCTSGTVVLITHDVFILVQQVVQFQQVAVKFGIGHGSRQVPD